MALHSLQKRKKRVKMFLLQKFPNTINRIDDIYKEYDQKIFKDINKDITRKKKRIYFLRKRLTCKYLFKGDPINKVNEGKNKKNSKKDTS